MYVIYFVLNSLVIDKIYSTTTVCVLYITSVINRLIISVIHNYQALSPMETTNAL